MEFLKRKSNASYLLITVFMCIAYLMVDYCQEWTSRKVEVLGMKRHSWLVEKIGVKDNPFIESEWKVNSNGYFHLKMDFFITDANGHPNLFQTADLNDGVRAEVSGTSLGIVMTDPVDDTKLKGVILADNLEYNKWYNIEVEGVSGHYLNAEIKGYRKYISWRERPSFKINKMMLGKGFDDSRRFRGEIKNASLIVGRALDQNLLFVIIYLVKLLLLIGYVYSLYKSIGMSWSCEQQDRYFKKEIYDPLMTLRAIACFMVLMGHGVMINFRPTSLVSSLNDGSYAWILSASPWGGVWIFFVLSGYLMGKGFYTGRYIPVWDAGVKRFYINRLLRIVPMYYISVLIVSVLVAPEIFQGKNILGLIKILTFDYDAEGGVNPIGSLWSVSTEMHYYLIVPLLFIVFKNVTKYSGMVAIFIVFISGLLFRAYVINVYGWDLWPREVYKTILGNLDLFMIGFFINPLIKYYKKKGVGVKYGLLIGYAMLVVLYVFISYVSSKGMVIGDVKWKELLFVYMPSFTGVLVFMIIAFFELSIISNVFVVRMLKRTEYFGLLTYALYVWHEPVYVSLSRNYSSIQTIGQSVLAIISTMLIVFVVSIVMYKLVEKPFEKKRLYKV